MSTQTAVLLPPSETLDFSPETQDPPPPLHRKIAKLPKPLRDLINLMLDDSLPARQIIAKLQASTDPALPYPISEVNISDWRKTGYQEYLRQQAWHDDLRSARESAADLGELAGGHQFQETLIQVALTDIFRALRDPQTKADPLNHIRLFNALARLNREALGLRKYNDLRADQAAAQLQPAAEAPSPERARDILFTAFERSMGFKAAPGPIGPDLNDFMSRAQAEAQAQVRTDSTPSPTAASVPVGPLPPAGDRGTRATHYNSEFKVESSMFEVQSSGSVPLTGSPTHPPASTPPVTRLPRQSRTEAGHPSPSPERCHECRALLPPLLPTGERPSSHCNKCGTGLRPPGALIEYCPKCRRVLQELNANGTRPTPECLHCNKPLPPPPETARVAHAVAEPPNIAA